MKYDKSKQATLFFNLHHIYSLTFIESKQTFQEHFMVSHKSLIKRFDLFCIQDVNMQSTNVQLSETVSPVRNVYILRQRHLLVVTSRPSKTGSRIKEAKNTWLLNKIKHSF